MLADNFAYKVEQLEDKDWDVKSLKYIEGSTL